METKHTKGEWALCQKSGTNDLCRVKDNSGGIIADFYWLGEGRNPSEAEANAKLFYAAPDLLDALQSALPYLHKETRIKAEQAIIKAIE